MNISGGIAFIFLTLTAVSGNNVQPRVISFKLSWDIDYPFEAIVIIGTKFACTASLITAAHVLTVAHCIQPVIADERLLIKVRVRLGSIKTLEGSSYRVKRISHHVNFSEPYPKFYIHDIAVIHLLNEAVLSDAVGPIGLPDPNSNVPPKVLVLLSLFAGTKQNNHTLAPLLMRIFTNTETADECQQYFQSYTLVKEQMCVEIDEECGHGPVDTGGPMVDLIESTILGLASGGCDNNICHGIPNIFTKVSEYIPYIREELSYGTSNYFTESPPPAVNSQELNNN